MRIANKIGPLLQRVTSSGEKLLYIDGLRFFAVMSVFIFHFIDHYDDHHKARPGDPVLGARLEGSVMGVILFFAISGFLIAMPFYSSYVTRDKVFDLGDYYFRRLTRLEPPYIVQLLLLFFLSVFVFGTRTFAETLPHLLASVFYCHELIYGTKPLLNPVLWTLEIEVQFYLLAPLLGQIFRLKTYTRKSVLYCLLLFFTFYRPIEFGFPTIFRYIHYFLTGFLALDMYMDMRDRKERHPFFDIVCFAAITLLWFSTTAYFTVVLLFLLLVYGPRTYLFVRILENRLIYTIGGMCYSIYMFHQKVIYLVSGGVLSQRLIGGNYLTDLFIRMAYAFLATLLLSGIFFILVERPTMKKQWWRYRSVRRLIFE
ncbi:peptidoglycan/LPS O-acetylase OafA/YrhL [Epilithonimonas hungarica]|uniref:acyltransferase family protein n=1 Tax=Epilithonimonas hungarica TaxID=454006 RepID=UPI00277FF976|nr:acyltransferase [Epilithonimonas hungarica]MDP9956028.1 peptidoglycan/LPS O-acetylase OafA/YrhL [Epilithonimonas hungarica]